jgi:hypothetical protein
MRLCSVAMLVPLLVVNYKGQIYGVSMILFTYQVYKTVFNMLNVIRLGKTDNTHTRPYNTLISLQVSTVGQKLFHCSQTVFYIISSAYNYTTWKIQKGADN